MRKETNNYEIKFEIYGLSLIVIIAYMRIFSDFSQQNILITDVDTRIYANMQLVGDTLIGIKNPEKLFRMADGRKLVYSNDWDRLYSLD